MSDYTKTTNFAAKDALATGDPNKKVTGTGINTEFDNIATAIATKANKITSPNLDYIVTQTGTGDLKNSGTAITSVVTKVGGATNGNIATLTAAGAVQDGGVSLSTLNSNVTTAITARAISAYASGSVTFTTGSTTTVVMNAEDFDTNAEYNPATGILTTGVAGKYLLIFNGSAVSSSDVTGDFDFAIVLRRIRGATTTVFNKYVTSIDRFSGSAGHYINLCLTTIVNANAADQYYIEITNGTDVDFAFDTTRSNFSVAYLGV